MTPIIISKPSLVSYKALSILISAAGMKMRILPLVLLNQIRMLFERSIEKFIPALEQGRGEPEKGIGYVIRIPAAICAQRNAVPIIKHQKRFVLNPCPN